MGALRVVFVDDEADFRETIIKRMQKRRIDAIGFGGGEDALRWLSTETADVVVLDVRCRAWTASRRCGRSSSATR